jgi:type IV secretion system protein VirB2
MRLKFKKTGSALVSLFVPAYILESAQAALALSNGAGGAGGGLPWETPLSTLANDLSGPTATLIAIIAIFVAGLALVFGEDLGKFARTLLMIVIAVGFLIGASKIVATLGFAI